MDLTLSHAHHRVALSDVIARPADKKTSRSGQNMSRATHTLRSLHVELRSMHHRISRAPLKMSRARRDASRTDHDANSRCARRNVSGRLNTLAMFIPLRTACNVTFRVSSAAPSWTYVLTRPRIR